MGALSATCASLFLAFYLLGTPILKLFGSFSFPLEAPWSFLPSSTLERFCARARRHTNLTRLCTSAPAPSPFPPFPRSGSRAPDRDGEKDVQIMQLQRALSTNEQARRLAAKRCGLSTPASPRCVAPVCATSLRRGYGIATPSPRHAVWNQPTCSFWPLFGVVVREQELLDSMEEIAARHEELK